jgi:transketolase
VNSLELIKSLEEKAIQIRKDICHTTAKIGYSHIGGTMSMTDIAVALYYHFLRYNPKEPKWEDRDRLVLSKAHCAMCLYNIYVDLGMYPKEELHNGYNQVGSRFGMHPNRKTVSGIEASLGSLGHGLSVAVGMAMAGRIDKKHHRVFCITGDGELNEGSNWEAIMAAGHYKLGNLVNIVDYNHRQVQGPTKEIMDLDPLDDKFKAFNWETIVINGNDMGEVVEALNSLPSSDSVIRRKPICIIANTVKGKGIRAAEEGNGWHVGAIGEHNLRECLDSIDSMRLYTMPESGVEKEVSEFA